MSGLTGRFLTRDPIGFKGSRWNLYPLASRKCLTGLDPSGKMCGGEYWTACTSFPIDEQDIIGMPWSNVPLNANVVPPDVKFGQTDGDMEVSCPCNECCGSWSFEYVNVHLQLRIFLDVEAHTLFREDLPGTYGHEQLHVRNLLNSFRNRECPDTLANAIPGPYASEAECKRACSFLGLYFQAAMETVLDEESHPDDENGNPIDDHEPFDGVDYPPIGGVFPEAPVKYPR